MKLYIFFTKNTPADRDIDYLNRRLGESRVPSIMMDADSRDGADLAQLYDVMQRPAVVLAADDGHLVQKWEGNLPPAQDVISTYSVG